MARATFVRRHRAGIASGVALTIAAAAVVTYAVTADGYKAHEADLNDGGVWVVNGKKGWSGRLNKPINQLDGVVPTLDGKTRLDVVQDGAAVVTLNLDASRGQSIETSRLESQDGGSAAIPTDGDVRDGRRHPRQRRRRDRRGLGRALRRRARQARDELGRPAVQGRRRGRARAPPSR